MSIESTGRSSFVDIGKYDFVFLGFLFLGFHSEFVVIVARRQKKYDYKKEPELVFHLKNILKAQSYKVNLSYRIFHFGFSEFFVLLPMQRAQYKTELICSKQNQLYP